MKKEFILFVCGHNSGRSQMAEVYFNFHNKNKNIEAFSAWTVIKWDWKINPKISALLLKKWIDIFNQPKKYFPKTLDFEVLKNAKKIYTMGCMDWWCLIWDRKSDFDFWLDDPALDSTNIEKMWEDFEGKMERIFEK